MSLDREKYEACVAADLADHQNQLERIEDDIAKLRARIDQITGKLLP